MRQRRLAAVWNDTHWGINKACRTQRHNGRDPALGNLLFRTGAMDTGKSSGVSIWGIGLRRSTAPLDPTDNKNGTAGRHLYLTGARSYRSATGDPTYVRAAAAGRPAEDESGKCFYGEHVAGRQCPGGWITRKQSPAGKHPLELCRRGQYGAATDRQRGSNRISHATRTDVDFTTVRVAVSCGAPTAPIRGIIYWVRHVYGG